MKRIILTAVAVILSLGVGCGKDSLTSLMDKTGGGTTVVAGGGSGPTNVAPSDPTEVTPNTGTTEQGLQASIMVRGENLNGVDSLYVTARDLRVFAGDQELAVTNRGTRVMNLTRLDHAWTLGKVIVPEGVENLRVEVTLDDYGAFVRNSATGDVDTRGTPIVFDVTTAGLSMNGHAVIHLDVAKSLMWTSGRSMMLIPELSVRY